MLARRLGGILPPLDTEEAMEVAAIHSAAGLWAPYAERPFRSPAPGTRACAFPGVGGLPGELSLAHHGVLLLDELAAFPRGALARLARWLDDGTVPSSGDAPPLPAAPVLAATLTPCPCGRRRSPGRRCACTMRQLRLHDACVPQPLLERFELRVEVPAIRFRALADPRPAERSSEVRSRVVLARERQRERFSGHSGTRSNARMHPREVALLCRVGKNAESLLRTAVARMDLSTRGYHAVLRIARTIADLDQAGEIDAAHVSEALQYRAADFPPRHARNTGT